MASLMSILRQAGFKGQALQMAYAIAMAESGGRANAYNGNANTGDKSYGLFQINMLGGMGPERRARYGLSSNSALFDPLTNAKIAYKMSNGGKNWGPWSTYKTGAYKQYYGGSGGATVTGGGGSTYNVKAVTPKLDKYELAATYGLTWATINGNKELKSLFNKAVSGGWDAVLFTAKLKNTKWWRTTSDSARKFFMMRTGDPATYTQKWKANQFALNKIAAEVGLGSQVKKGKPSALLKKAIMYKMRDGWSDARIKAYFGNYVTVHKGQMWGEAGEVFDQLQQLAYMNGQKYSSSWYQKYVKEIVAGRSTIENTGAKIRSTAAAKYSAFADQIKAGQNAMDLAAPYINTVARLLEVPETDVDLFENHVANAMQGAHAGQNFTLWQFENYVRNDPKWRKTNNARESMFSVARQVAKDFGMAY